MVDTRIAVEAQAVSTEPGTVVVGVIVAIDEGGVPCVSFPGCPLERGVSARSTTAFSASEIGSQVAVLFENGDMGKPVVLGKILLTQQRNNEPSKPHSSVNAVVDDERVTICADREIVLRCGEASITLTQAGKIIVRGTYILNRSSGVNKIKGASVQIN